MQSFLGPSAWEVLTQNYHLDGLAADPDKLHDLLTQVFGRGALVLERVIVRDLYSACGIRFEDSERFNFNLEKCIDRARSQYDPANQTEHDDQF